MNSTYSVAAGYFDEVRAIVEQGISIVFEERENLYMGGRYFNFRGSENERIRLLDNTTLDFDGEVLYPEYGQYSYVLIVEGVDFCEYTEEKVKNNPRISLLGCECY